VTSFLRLNGITVPVALAGASVGQEDIGKMRRSVNATAVVPRRATKKNWKFNTVIKTAAEALAWRDLITGRGHVLSFDAQNWYTSKGMAPVSVAGGWSFTSSSPLFGAAMAQWTTGNALWAMFSASSLWTVAWWLNQSGAGWHHYVRTSAGNKYIDGVLTPGGSLLGFGGVSAGVLTMGSTTASELDDVVALPYVVPDSWPAQMFDWGSSDQPFSELPVLTADGLFIEQNNAPISVVGGEPSGRPLVAKMGGALVHNLHDFSFQLFEK
jgi:hypothetical protein